MLYFVLPPQVALPFSRWDLETSAVFSFLQEGFLQGSKALLCGM